MASKLYSMTPKEIVAELDKYIIGQDEAKKSVAIALRNRYRRSLLPDEMREEITPKNILMMGPTGCGKTEIARRLAKLMDAPFVKVEATKFTEVGYVGRDVDSMVRDLVEASMRVTKQKKLEEKYSIADKIVEEKLVEAIIPGKKKKPKDFSFSFFFYRSSDCSGSSISIWMFPPRMASHFSFVIRMALGLEPWKGPTIPFSSISSTILAARAYPSFRRR